MDDMDVRKKGGNTPFFLRRVHYRPFPVHFLLFVHFSSICAFFCASFIDGVDGKALLL